MDAPRDIRLVDAGDGRRLERFGERLVDRPHPAAVGARSAIREWRAADLRFERGAGWSGATEAWAVDAAGAQMELRPTPAGGLGLFPEQLENAEWLGSAIRDRSADGSRPTVLNLFAHTGLITLVAASAGAGVTHVAGSRPTVAWARRNAARSGLAHAPIRWIVDDALAFTRREARRGRRYDGLILDPPAYGHGARASFALESGLGDLLAACASVAAPRAFVLLTAHSEGLDADRVLEALGAAFGRPTRTFETVPLILVADTGATLPLGFAIRSRR